MESKKHKELVEAVKSTLNKHNCRRESPIFRDGWKFLDLECHPHNSKIHKPTAIECEINSSKIQRQSNLKDLAEWKRKNPSGVTFQIENIQDINTRKLVRRRRF